MPFDGTNFPEPRPRRRAMGDDTAITVIIVLVAFGLLIMPISMVAFVDIVDYLRGH